ncbi:uncharacterized protein LOC132204628 [Neocloeon triangulifer]|uniref:uncharacterized protein LOC132204628 n=1 Tax=Neocloeon triangulifer TaxID=2078957 RepID=UPI00286F62B5|nr:uncharacterized protein LOC132204628 [Neocloeon triangulifer]XP_059489234.1 uncharacterized protein LOC132204628 [Neocloeon triangulifer]
MKTVNMVLVHLFLLCMVFKDDKTAEAKKGKKGTLRYYNNRKMIIKCCGKLSCTNFAGKVMPASIISPSKSLNYSAKLTTMLVYGSTETTEQPTEVPNTDIVTSNGTVEELTSAIFASESLTDAPSSSSTSTTTRTPSYLAKLLTTLVLGSIEQPTEVPSTDPMKSNGKVEELTSAIFTSESLTEAPSSSSTSIISTSTRTVSSKTSVPSTTTSTNIRSKSTHTIMSLTSTSTQATKKLTVSTTTTTTTKAPTREELIRGICDTNFKKNEKLLDRDGTLKDPEKYGFWVQSCGQQFLFGKSLATWRDNFVRCYEIGMEPLTFENASKRQCFTILVAKWKYTSNYWTSALRVNATDFSWCTKNGSFSVEKGKLPWAAGQPQNFNNSENCLHLNVSKANANFTFSDRTCTDPQIFACQGRPTPAPTCSSPVCPNVTCAKNDSFFAVVGKTQYLTNPSSHGRWFTYNGRTYLFSFPNKSTTYIGAMKACCEIGMTLLSLEYDYKYKSVIQAIKENVSSSDFFRTSGSDRGCESNFGYCTVNRTLRQKAVWAPGQPDNADGYESSVVVFIDSAKAQLFDYNEDSKIRYICEVRDSSNASSGGTAVQDECAAIYNVTQTEIDGLLNPSIKKGTRIRCFLKCLGENSGLMVNGKILENEILAILENIAAGNFDELKKSMEVMDECGKSTSGMDECDKAAQMIKCSSEKAPKVLKSVVMEMDKVMPVEKYPLPPVAVCPDTSCSGVPIDTVLRNAVTNCVNSFCELSSGFALNRCNKKYYHHKIPVPYNDASSVCCRVGMKIASIESDDELNCLSESTHYLVADWTWVALSRVNSTVPRWCTSNATVSFSGYTTILDSSDPALDIYIVQLRAKTIRAAQHDYFDCVLCK